MAGEGWIKFEGYEGRLDPRYAGKYGSLGVRYPLIERTRRWDIVRVEGEPVGGVYRADQFTVLSRGHDMMEKAHDEAAAYRLHFKRCAGVGVCEDIGHPGGPKRSMSQALAPIAATEPVEPPARVSDEVGDRAIPTDAPDHADPDSRADDADWAPALHPSSEVSSRTVGDGLALRVVPLEFELWDGPRLTMAEDCNKRGGRIVGDREELSCAEVEIVKRLRAAGWDAAWVQAWKCGRKSWGNYIADAKDLPPSVQALQAVAGASGGHPDVLAWKGDRIVAIESKGPSDALKASQIEWFARSLDAGIRPDDVGVVEWRASVATVRSGAKPPAGPPEPILGRTFENGLAYAVELHRKQARKGTTIPYMTHLMTVCALVLEDGGTEDEAIAALLHDGPEDQGGQPVLDEIRTRFGPEVAAMVDGLSDTLEQSKPDWHPRKKAYLERLASEPESVLRVSLADKLHNLRSIDTDLKRGRDLSDVFNAGLDAQAWYYGELLPIFEAKLPNSRNLPEFQRLVREVFGAAT